MSASKPVLEGVFAINKPPSISSAQVIRDVQDHFNPSELFKPWLQREQAKIDAESPNQKQKRKARSRRVTSVKMGHGGTLDPMATGVLILGVGSGTKQLGYFSTECTKTYEAVVLFGAATDSYDTEGKIIGRKPYGHITEEMVKEKLVKFRGKGMQKPPIFSAIRVQGKRLYEYAREGKEVPVAIQDRPVEVYDLELLEWLPAGTHKWHWPEVEAEQTKKQFAVKQLNLGDQEGAIPAEETSDIPLSGKRKREDDGTQNFLLKRPKKDEVEALEIAPVAEAGGVEGYESGMEPLATNEATSTGLQNGEEPSTKPESESEALSSQDFPPCPAPACRIRMTVTSGFYVRSLCHDLGAAVGSLGLMTSLVRIRQGDFELDKNVLLYDELRQGEGDWGPKVQQMLENWVDKDRIAHEHE